MPTLLKNVGDDGKDGIDGRADLLYGEDYVLAVSQGWEVNPSGANWDSNEYYGLAPPQLLPARCPLWRQSRPELALPRAWWQPQVGAP